jgi:hypothetical protein
MLDQKTIPNRHVHISVKSALVADELVKLSRNLGWTTFRLDQRPSDTMCQVHAAEFNEMDYENLYNRAAQRVQWLSAILHISRPDLDTTLRVTGVGERLPDGRSFTDSAPITLQIVAPNPFEELNATQPDGSSMLVRLMRLAETQPDVARALSLLPRDTSPAWGDLYHLIEFFGMKRGIAARGWATEAAVNLHQQTANHYRHRGKDKPPELPANPPTIEESRVFVMGLMRRWLEELPD